MNFKDQLDKDLEEVFYDTAEFAEVMRFYYNGEPKKASVVLDSAEYNDRKKAGSDNAEGLFSVDLIMYISLKDLGKMPRKGEEIEINNEYYEITKVKNDLGQLTLFLEMIME